VTSGDGKGDIRGGERGTELSPLFADERGTSGDAKGDILGIERGTSGAAKGDIRGKIGLASYDPMIQKNEPKKIRQTVANSTGSERKRRCAHKGCEGLSACRYDAGAGEEVRRLVLASAASMAMDKGRDSR
jgi:hypothetical protein